MPDHNPRPADRFTRDAPLSLDPQTNRLTVTFSTGAPVRRRDHYTGQDYTEILVVSADAIDLSRLNSGGAPVLNTHSSFDLTGIIGVVESARVERGAAVADIRLTDRPEVAGIVRDIANGISRNVSVGYTVDQWSVAPATADQLETRTAVRWTPYEISLVPIPADVGAMTRSAPTERFTAMNSPTAQDAIQAERSRASEIMTIARLARLPESWASDHVRRGTEVEAARGQAFEFISRHATHRVPADHAAFMAQDEAPRTARAIEDALFSRLTGRAPAGQATEFRGMSMPDMFRALLEARGERGARWLRPAQLMSRMHVASDFPNLLRNSGSRALLDMYQRAQSPLRSALARVKELPDYRDASLLRLGEAALLHEVPEGAEITRGTVKEREETYRLRDFARIFGMTNQAVINDDLGAFSDFLTNMAGAAAETEAVAILALLTANAGMGANLTDGTALFDASRGNTGTGVVGVTAVGVGRAAMRKTTGLDSVTPIAAEPRYLLVAPDAETLADQVVTAITPNVTTAVNPFAGVLQKLCEPRLSGAPWYLFADPAAAPVIECAYLEGGPKGPVLDTKEGWDVLGIEFRAVLTFGCGLVGWRGAYRSTGA